MNKSTHLEGLNCPCSLMLAACLAITLLPAAAQGPAWSVADRGAFYSVWQATVSSTNALTGAVSEQLLSYTELGDGLNYWNNGQWIDSQDLIEIAPTGAAAVHGQMTASFSGDITATGAITLTTPSGLVFQSHPIGLYYADAVSGKVAQIGSAQTTEGVLYPPNVIVFTNVLSGLNADLMLIWTKGGFEQNLVIKEAPPAPQSFGLSSAACRLQFWTAMDCPAPQEQRPVLLGSGLVDHILMYPDCWFPVGCAFAFGSAPLPAPGEAAAIRLYSPSKTNAVATAKSLGTIAGQQVLIEEINYADLLPAFSGLSQAAVSPANPGAVELAARGQLLPAPASAKPQGHPIQVASAPYSARGVVLDYPQTLSGSSTSFTFTNGTTYYVPSGFTVSPGTATFQTGACVKSASNAYLIAGGPVSFPASGPSVVFTCASDNSYGTVLTNSTSEASYAAGEALWMYYQTTGSTVRNALFRWAQTGIEYSESGVVNSPALNSSVFQNCNIGAYVNIPNDTLYLSSVSQCNVVTPISDCMYCGSVSGPITTNCGTATNLVLVNASRWSGFEGEPTITVNPASPTNLFLAAMHTTSPYNFPILFTATSTNGGTNWTGSALTNANNVSDVSAAFDAFGNLFFCHLLSNGAESGVVVLLSTDGGRSFNTLTNFSEGCCGLDQPKLTTGPSGSPGTSSVWITYCDELNTNIVASGAAVTGLGQVGAWSSPAYVLNSTQYNWGSIAIGPTGQVALVFQHVTFTNESRYTQIRMSVNPGGLGGTFATAWDVLVTQMGCLQLPPAAPHDGIDVSPCLAWDRTGGQYRGRLYMAYTDRPQNQSNSTEHLRGLLRHQRRCWLVEHPAPQGE